MAETIEKARKAKAPAKPRAAAGTTKQPAATTRKPAATKKASVKKTIAEQVIATTPTHEEIARLAVQYWAERGHQHGQDEHDWLRAEQELMKMAS